MSRKRGAAIWGAIIVVASLSGPAVSRASERTLTLDQAEAMAVEHNRQIRLAEESLVRAQAGVTAARATLLPSLSASGSYTRNIEKPVMFLPAAFGGGSAEMGSNNAYAFSVTASQPLFLGFAGITGYRLAQTQHASAEQELAQTRQEVLLSVREAYLAAVLTRVLVDVQREAVAQAESSLAQVRRRYDVGQVSGFDLLRAQVQLSNTRPQLVNAQSNRRLADAGLRLVLGMEANETPVPADTLAEFRSQWLDRPLDQLVQIAMQHRPDLIISDYSQRAASQGVSLSKSAYYPALIAFGTAQWQGQSESGMPDNFPRSTMAGLQLSWTLWDSWKTPSTVQQARVGLRQANVASDLTRDGARLEIQAAQEKLQSAAVNLQSQRETVGQAMEALRLSRVMYDNGSATQLDILNAQLALTASRMQYASNLHDYHIAHAQLEKALGLIGQ